MPTRSMPIVSCRPSCCASLSLVPTPSVPDTSTGSRYLPDRSNRAPNPPSPPHHFGPEAALDQRLDAFDECIAGIDVDAGIAICQRGWVVHASPGSARKGAGPGILAAPGTRHGRDGAGAAPFRLVRGKDG